jgi:FAD/FMN-containing dehydrogenase
MAGESPRSWGRFPRFPQHAVPYLWRDSDLPLNEGEGKTYLPFGNGRSYGDVCLNEGGVLIKSRGLDRLLAFNEETGALRCESGVLLSEILQFAVPKGWFLPVTPGTQFVTIGGAIANDVHGKNHHRQGTFGRHVTQFQLLRSDGTRILCSPTENPEWYGSTIGGLGLTGMITWAEIVLKPIHSPYIDQEVIRFQTLGEFFALDEASDQTHEYTVAWVDCLARGPSLGRGLFIRGNHASPGTGRPLPSTASRLGVPFTPPFSLVNRLTLRAFNTLYYRNPLKRSKPAEVPYASFFYPLDALGAWNRIYGPGGFLQHQCVLPLEPASEALEEILNRIAEAGAGSFLAVLKRFGYRPSPGLLSFPRPGITLALDFPFRGGRTLDLLQTLDRITLEAGGAVNPSKDACMSAESFQRFFPRWTELTSFIDPCFSSSFWRRVTVQGSQTPGHGA